MAENNIRIDEPVFDLLEQVAINMTTRIDDLATLAVASHLVGIIERSSKDGDLTDENAAKLMEKLVEYGLRAAGRMSI